MFIRQSHFYQETNGRFLFSSHVDELNLLPELKRRTISFIFIPDIAYKYLKPSKKNQRNFILNCLNFS